MSTRVDPSIYPRLHEYMADQLGTLVLRLLPDVADALLAHAGGGIKPGLAVKLTETARLLREEAAVRAELALDHFVRLQLDSVGDETLIAAASAEEARGSLPLSDAALLEQILARELASAVRAAFQGSYAHYLRRLEHLTFTRLRDDEHSLGARALGLALVFALKPFAHTQPISLHLRPILLSVAVAPLARLIASCDQRLIKAGVLPDLPHVHWQNLRQPTGDVDRGLLPRIVRRPAEGLSGGHGTRDVASTFVQHASRQVINDIRASAVLAENSLGKSRSRHAGYRRAQRLPRIDSIERDAVSFARQHGVAPYSQEARALFFKQIRQQVDGVGGDKAVLAVLDLVNALFDYAASDRRLPEAARILLWRLQMPAVTLASLDAGYLGDDSRSVRRLVEQLAAIAIAYPEEMRPNRALYQRLQTVVRAVEIVAHAFHVRSQVLSEQVRHEYQRTMQGMKQLLSRLARSRRDLTREVSRQPNRRDYSRRPSRMRETVVSEDIRRLLDYRLGDSRVPESVKVFLQDVWLRHLRTAALRDGTSSQSYQVALKVVDDLLWTLGKEGANPNVRNELIQCIPPMLSMLTAGIQDVGARPESYSAFFDEIFLIHLRRLQGYGGSAATLIAHETEAAAAMRVGDDSWASLVRSGSEAAAIESTGSTDGMPEEGSGVTLHHPLPLTEDGGRSTATGTTRSTDPSSGTTTLERSVPRTLSGTDTCSAAAASARLQELIANTSMEDLPARPTRLAVPASAFRERFQPGQWLELVSRDGRSKYAKVVWLNERRTMVLLLLKQPGRRIMTREVGSLMKRVRQHRLFALL
ncbi:MAG: DUF1631 family protein [Lautropia sp.]|nr:DUF1631 family protein [Lautropia sp.]